MCALLAGRYELLRPLGEGGMAALWLAKLVGSSGFAKLVAVKRILPALAQSPKFADMFLDEGRIAADLRHPNIAQVLEVGSDGGELFIAMELLEGLDVYSLLVRSLAHCQRLPVGASVQIVLDAAQGLAYAHAKKSLDGEPLDIVHRDVSPQNLVVTVDGVCKVVDFGIAKAKSQTTLTEAGTLKGKCAYMAPEMVLGDPFDHRADQFALGVVLWELLTGERLFRRDGDIDTLRAVLEHEVPAPSSLVEGLPAALDALVLRALDADPDARFETCDHFAAALDEFTYAQGLRAGPRLLGAIVRDRMRDAAPTTSEIVERTLPEAAVMSGIGDEVTSVEAAQLAAPRPLKPQSAVGRAKEIAAVRLAFADGIGPVTLVGPAGVGKTHLARAIASTPGAPASTGGFDAAYFVEMEGAESGEDIVTLLAFALGFANDALSSDLERAAERAGKALAARGTALVVLDGVDDIVAGAAPLARSLSARCRVLVTSQAPLGVMGERVIDVGPLSVDDAVALLVDVAGSDDAEALVQIAKGAGCMPASLLMAGRFIVERRAHPVAAELSRRAHGERSLSLLLDGALTQELDDDDRSALLRIAPHRGPLDRALVDVLVPERDPDEVVAALRAHGLLVGDELVPAVRDRALDELAARGELLGKRHDHAAAVAGRAFVELLRADDAKTATAAMAALTRLHAGLEDAAATLLRSDSDPDDGTRLLTVAIALDKLAKKPASPAHVRLLEEALARAGAVVDRRLRARGLEALGDHKKLAGRLHDARRDYLLALDLCGDSDDAARALLNRNVADLDLDAGELVSAEEHARRAIAFARKAGSTRHMARSTWTLGRVALLRGIAAQAEILLERAASGFREDGDDRFAARATFELGRCAEARGDAHAARALFRRALAAHEPEGDVAFAERARVHLGLLAAHLGERGEAKSFLDAALDSAVRRGDVKAERAVREHLARLDG